MCIKLNISTIEYLTQGLMLALWYMHVGLREHSCVSKCSCMREEKALKIVQACLDLRCSIMLYYQHSCAGSIPGKKKLPRKLILTYVTTFMVNIITTTVRTGIQ